jgi:hypothetical protein
VVLGQQYSQQGAKLFATDQANSAAGSALGNGVALSSDGTTLVVGGPNDNSRIGATWVFTRATNGQWSEQGLKLTGNDYQASGAQGVQQGAHVAVSADGNTLITGGCTDTNDTGAAWVYTRSNGTWTQQGAKLVGTVATGTKSFQCAVAISDDGNTALLGGSNDSNAVGAAWVFTRSGSTWTQQTKLVGTPPVSSSGCPSEEGFSVALSGDGNTALLGAPGDNNCVGAAWVFTRSGGTWTQQSRLSGAGGTGIAPEQGTGVALSYDGNTAAVSGLNDNTGVGAVWIFTRSNGQWTQQGSPLVGTSATNSSGVLLPNGLTMNVALSSDGNTLVFGRPWDSNGTGAAWVFKRAGGSWSQQAKLVGSGSETTAEEGLGVAISRDASTIALGGPADNNVTGAVWPFVQSGASSGSGPTAPIGVMPFSGSNANTSLTFTFNDPRGFQDLDVLNVLINNFLDGRNACYLAYSRSGGVLYLVGNDGGTLSQGLVLGGAGTISNSQCSVNAAGSSASGSGNTLTLVLNMTFTGGFGGNKIVYMAARDLQGGNSGWQALGVWQAPFTPAGTISVVSFSPTHPAAAAGTAQTLTATLADSRGTADFGVINVLVNNFIDGRQACYLAYVAAANTLYLVDDAGDAGGPFAGSMVLTGGAGSISNSQCSVSNSGSSVTKNGNNLTLALNMTFKSALAGNRIVWVAGRDVASGNNTDWQASGTTAVQ